MIVISRNFGQLGNRLVLAAKLIAASEEYGVPLVNPSFAQYAPYFRSTVNDLWCRYPTTPNDDQDSLEGKSPSNWTREALYHAIYLTGRTLSHLRLTRYPFHVLRLGSEGKCDLTSDSFQEKAKSKRPFLVSGWHFDPGPLLDKHADTIRQYFRIIPEHEHNVESLMTDIRQKTELVIGVHIRHGDYANFRGGMYYYSTEKYVAMMRQIRSHFQDQEVTFLVCGNGKLRLEDFGDLNVRFGTGHLVEDMYAFAQCDRIIGPPSTYTGWASFYGNVPLLRMNTADSILEELGRDEPLAMTEALAAA